MATRDLSHESGGADRDDRDSATAIDVATHRRFPRLRHYVRGLDHYGVLFGWLFFLLSLTPSLVPRSWQTQGLISGVTVAEGYALGVVLSWTIRRVGVRTPSARVRRRAWQVLGVLALATIPIILWLSSGWQDGIRRAVGAPSSGRYLYLGVFVVAAGVAAALIGLARLIHDVYVVLAARLVRVLPRVAARLVAVGLVVALALGLGSGLVYQGLMRAADATFSAADHGNKPGVSQPTSSLRSGGPYSLVSWDSLGKEGRAFVSYGPRVADIGKFTARRAVEPIRVYAGTASAPTLRDEAALVLDELKRTGAFQRELVAVATATGRGWVDPALVDPLEYMYGGDTAVAAMQYSYMPSWISFLVDRTTARQAGRTLFDTVYGYWATLPAAHRPRLVVFGESLGAYGADAAFSGVADMTSRTSGALFAGPPNGTEVWRELKDARRPGSPEWLPVYGDGQTVRFAASAADLRGPDGGLTHPKIVYLQHASDPIVWWSTRMIWRRPDWLGGSRGPDVAPQMRWYPFVTFWQISCDLIAGTGVAPGHGHLYGPEIPTAWAAILHPPGWTDAATTRLTTSQVAGT